MKPTLLLSIDVFVYAVAHFLALSSSVVVAQDATTPGSISIFESVGNEGPWHESKSEFESFVDNRPNATGIFPVAGPNISAPYSAASSSKIEGWSWSIAVVADLPIVNSSILGGQYSDKFYTGGKLAFHGPPSLLQSSSASSSSQNLTVNDDWELCVFQWQLDGASYPDALRSDDGTCSSVLNSQCISDMEKAVSKNTGSTPWCKCPLSRDIPSCAALGNASALWDSTCGGSYFNASAIRAWKDGILDLESFGGTTAHDRGNSTAYNYIGSIAWPVMTSFGNGNGSHTAATMSCVRATNATEGSTAPMGNSLDEGQEGGSAAGGNSTEESNGTEGSGTLVVVNWITLGAILTVSLLMSI